MTKDQIKAAFPGKVGTLMVQLAVPTETIGIDRVALAGIPFRAAFFFDDGGGLNDIVFDLPDSTRSEAQFRKLEDWLSHEYGTDPIRGARGNIVFQSDWLLPDNVITMTWTRTGILVIGFRKPSGETAASLMKGWTEIPGTPSLGGDSSTSRLSAKSASQIQPISDASRSGKWHVSESKSQFDDSRTVVITLIAENSIQGWLVTFRPQLILRCQERKTEMFVVTGMAATVELGEFQRHTVRVRYDDDAATSVVTNQSTDNKSLFFPDAVSTAVRMWNAQVLLIGFTPFNASPVTMRFDVSGLPFAIQSLREACGW